MGSSTSDDIGEFGFAKLQGRDFEYYMHSYSILLGRNSKTSAVDVDLTRLGGGINISRHHAHIFYDFTLRRFSLEVLGRNGCYVEGVHHLPGSPPVKLDSQDHLQIGDIEFYFLLPSKRIVVRPMVLPIPQSKIMLTDLAVGTGSSHDDVKDDNDDNDSDDDNHKNDESS